MSINDIFFYLYFLSGALFLYFFCISFKGKENKSIFNNIIYLSRNAFLTILAEGLWLVIAILNIILSQNENIFLLLVLPPIVAVLTTLSSFIYVYFYTDFKENRKNKKQEKIIIPTVHSWVNEVSQSLTINSVTWNLHGKRQNMYGRIIIDINVQKDIDNINWAKEARRLNNILKYSTSIEIRSNGQIIYPKQTS